MKILIAPDKFKGSLTAEEVGKTIAKACLAQKPSSQINFQPLADG
ncbi:MAG TPA: glycerate kinase, partial [Saprospiraceae bacterium]|nr:glycerate kinase [Saprospiraceae bacterium]